VEVAGKPGGNKTGDPTTDYPNLTSATALHAEGITGYGVTVAVLDSGSMSHGSLNKSTKGDWRFLSQYDATTDEVIAQINMEHLGTKRAGVVS
jgi:hypothetical protein